MSASKTHFEVFILYFVSHWCFYFLTSATDSHEIRHLFWTLLKNKHLLLGPVAFQHSVFIVQKPKWFKFTKQELLNYGQFFKFFVFFFILHTLICYAMVFYECSVHFAEIPCWVQNQTEAFLLVSPTIQKSCLFNCCILHIISHGFTHSLPPPCDTGLHGECMLKLPVGLRKEHTGVGLADEVFVCCPADAFVVLLLVWVLQR